MTLLAKTESETLYVELKLDAGASLPLPETEELAVYVIDGNVDVDGEALSQAELAVLEDNAKATITAGSAAHVMLCGGARLSGDRIVWWNFVSSSRDRIEQAKRDWNEGRFDPVPGETDFIPLPRMGK